MKKLNSIKLSIVVIAVLCGLLHSAIAQTTATNTEQWRKIHLQNIRPDMLAYWLDPAHQVQPVEYRKELPSIFYSWFEKQSVVPEVSLDFPNLSKPNKDSFNCVLAADDSQSNLWVLSSQDVFNMIEILSGKLDKPVSRFEFEVQEVAINPADLNALSQMPSPDSTSAKPYWGRIDSVKPLFSAGLRQLVAQRKATIITSPRVTTLNDFPGVISVGRTNPIGTPEIPSFDVCRLILSITPNHIENESNVTTLTISTFEDKIRTTQQPPLEDTRSWIDDLENTTPGARSWLTTMYSLRDNETVALSGFSSTSLGIDDKNQNVVLFLTMREVHGVSQGQSVVSHKQSYN